MIFSFDGATIGRPVGDAACFSFKLGQYRRRAQFIVFDDQKSALTDLVTWAAFFKSNRFTRLLVYNLMPKAIAGAAGSRDGTKTAPLRGWSDTMRPGRKRMEV
jgi:hypothetical protein